MLAVITTRGESIAFNTCPRCVSWGQSHYEQEEVRKAADQEHSGLIYRPACGDILTVEWSVPLLISARHNAGLLHVQPVLCRSYHLASFGSIGSFTALQLSSNRNHWSYAVIYLSLMNSAEDPSIVIAESNCYGVPQGPAMSPILHNYSIYQLFSNNSGRTLRLVGTTESCCIPK